MKFKELKEMIAQPKCYITIDNKSELISVANTDYDNYKIIFVRSKMLIINGYSANSYIEVFLDESDVSKQENKPSKICQSVREFNK